MVKSDLLHTLNRSTISSFSSCPVEFHIFHSFEASIAYTASNLKQRKISPNLIYLDQLMIYYILLSFQDFIYSVDFGSYIVISMKLTE